MLLKTIIILLIFVPFRIFSTDTLCRLIEFNVPQGLFEFHTNEIEEKLFYKTDRICQNKPVFRSMKYQHLYQFQAPNNRWWTLYDTKNSTYKLGMYEWCDAWNFRPLLVMPLGIFQHPLDKPIRSQRWKQVFIHEKNRSYTYKSVANVSLKCYQPPSTSVCQTHQLTFLFDLTESTTKNEFQQMKLLAKTLIWLLYNQTKIVLSYYSDTFHILHSFDEKSTARSLEHLFDSVDIMDKSFEIRKRFSVPWFETIHSVVTRIFKRRFLLPVAVNNSTEQYQSFTNITADDDDDDADVYTDPYPLVYSDEDAIKTILNITTYEYRKKRSVQKPYDQSNHVLAILTSRSKSLYDYTEQDRNLAKFISSVPLRILAIDFNKLSNKKSAEYVHSAFIHNSKYALVSAPVTYNYIETYEESGDAIYGHQLFDDHHRLCHPAEETFLKANFTTVIIETNESATVDCSLLTLFHNLNNNATLKDKFDYTFYETSDRCFSSPVYRSLSDRNLYAQRIANGQWVIVRVDPLLPSAWSIQQKLALTTTSTLSPEFFYATDYANGPMMEENTIGTSIEDVPISVPHCSNTPGVDILWESVDNQIAFDYLLQTPRQWKSTLIQSSVISPICNKYKISCQKSKFDLMVLIDAQQDYAPLIQTFLSIFLALIDPYKHRFSLVVISSTTTDTLQYHVPLTALNAINNKLIENFLSYTDEKNTSTVPLNQHLERISQYLINNQELNSQQVILTITSRFNFNQPDMKELIQRFSSIRYMALDPHLKTDDERTQLLSSLTSSPSNSNLFWSYAANRDLTFNTVFRILESLCGYLQ